MRGALNPLMNKKPFSPFSYFLYIGNYLSWSENPAHNRTVMGSSPIFPTNLLNRDCK